MKKLITMMSVLVLVLCLGVGLTACGGGSKVLAKPVLTVSGTTVSWAAVANAANYTVDLDGTEQPVQTALSVSLDGLPAKTYTIKVRANKEDGSKFKNSDWSAAKTVKINMNLSEFLTAITTVDGNFSGNYSYAGGNYTDFQVNGEVSYQKKGTSIQYCHIIDGETQGYSNMVPGGYFFASVPANVIDGLALYRLLGAVNEAMFTKVGTEWQLNGSFEYVEGFFLTSMTIDLSSENIIITATTMYDSISTDWDMTVSFGTATVAVDDWLTLVV